jgi:hypothetical protein
VIEPGSDRPLTAELRDTAQRLVDPGYRLPGEDPASTSPADARRWADVYKQLTMVKEKVLEGGYRDLTTFLPEVSRELKENDMVVLETQLARCRQRLEFWQLRLKEIGS